MRVSIVALIVATVGYAGAAFGDPLVGPAIRMVPMNAPALNVVRPLAAPIGRAPVIAPRAIDFAPRALGVAPQMRQIEPRSSNGKAGSSSGESKQSVSDDASAGGSGYLPGKGHAKKKARMHARAEPVAVVSPKRGATKLAAPKTAAAVAVVPSAAAVSVGKAVIIPAALQPSSKLDKEGAAGVFGSKPLPANAEAPPTKGELERADDTLRRLKQDERKSEHDDHGSKSAERKHDVKVEHDLKHLKTAVKGDPELEHDVRKLEQDIKQRERLEKKIDRDRRDNDKAAERRHKEELEDLEKKIKRDEAELERDLKARLAALNGAQQAGNGGNQQAGNGQAGNGGQQDGGAAPQSEPLADADWMHQSGGGY